MKALVAIIVATLLSSWSGLCLTNQKVPLIVAHRGASHDAPENTVAAFRLAWQQKADAIEADFYLTKDGRVVCIHDATTGRTAEIDLPVGQATLQELRRLDVGSWKGKRWGGEKIPTIEEVFATVPEGKEIYAHVKCGPEIFPPLKEALRRSGLEPGQVRILTSDKSVITEAKKQLPGIAVFWLMDEAGGAQAKQVSPDTEQFIANLKTGGAKGISIDARAAVSSAFVEALRRYKMELHVWNVDDISTTVRTWHLGAGSLTTDHPGWFRMLLRG